MSLGDRINELRKENKLTQEEFGNKIGLKKASVSLVEKGVQGISDGVLLNIINEFCVNETWLKEGIGEKYNKNLQKQKEYLKNELKFISSELSQQQHIFFKRLNEFSEDQQTELVTCIEEIYAILNIDFFEGDNYFFYCEILAGMLVEFRRYIEFLCQTNELNKKIVDGIIDSIGRDIKDITELFSPGLYTDVDNNTSDIQKKDSQKSLSSDEENILQLYRQLSDRDKIKMEGIMEEKISEQSLIKKGQLLTSGHGEEAATSNDRLNYA